MSKAVQEQVNQLFETIKDLKSLEEIKPYCEQFNEWLNTSTTYSKASLGTVLSRAGFYKKFKSIPLEQGKNAESVPKHDAQGNVTGYELKHYVLLLCGLDKKDWEERNETTRVSDRLMTADEEGNTGIEINPDEYLEVTANLLASDNPHELAVGLIASTGRRPHEILARGKFTAVEGESYQLMFEGQGKKRGEKPVFKISTLFPADYVIERFTHLRKDATMALSRDMCFFLQDDPKRLDFSLPNTAFLTLLYQIIKTIQDKGFQTILQVFTHISVSCLSDVTWRLMTGSLLLPQLVEVSREVTSALSLYAKPS